jgi:hypothetical protein
MSELSVRLTQHSHKNCHLVVSGMGPAYQAADKCSGPITTVILESRGSE